MNMLDQILLAPYYLSLRLRHALYDSGLKKTYPAGLPSISIGNVTVGGTGKTPHTEMLIRLLSGHTDWSGKQIAVLSRGYKRKSRGFQQVMTEESDAAYYGDEPVQIKRKFPDVTVAVDKDRVEGCGFLLQPDSLKTSRKGRKCRHKEFAPADIVILDDAFQYRRLRPSVSIVLVNYNRPVSKDHLLPAGRLRDLPERLKKADILIVTKCPYFMEDDEKRMWAEDLGLKNYSPGTCAGQGADGKTRHVFFTTVRYDAVVPVFKEGDMRYAYSKQAVLFSGIADDKPLMQYLSDTYRIVQHLSFGDHHEFSRGDMNAIRKTAEEFPTSILVTTEKDSQRLLGIKDIPKTLRERTFYAPIRADFLSDDEQETFLQVLSSFLQDPSAQ